MDFDTACDLPIGEIPRLGRNGVAEVIYGDDSALGVQFYMRECFMPQIVKNDEVVRVEATVKKLYVKIQLPSTAKSREGDVVDREATEEDKMRFAMHYRAFMSGAQEGGGTPIDAIKHPLFDAACLNELKTRRIFFAEQLAAYPDAGLHYLGLYGRILRQEARKFLDRKQVNHTNDIVDELKAKIAELSDKVEAAAKKPKPKPKPCAKPAPKVEEAAASA